MESREEKMTSTVCEFTNAKIWLTSKGVYHREDGPAFIGDDGAEEWWDRGVVHRGDGPAKTWPDGYHEWWWHGQKYWSSEKWAKAAGIFETDEFTMIKLEWG